ncbi:MAG: protein phosphatase CheZ [Rhodocyclaceae bacterium]|nr:protein phosphatase CheZ [Rhodocyclaceae bacterium]
MAKKLKFDESGDSDELQALFDTIAATSGPAPKPRLEVIERAPAEAADTADLQDLFDQTAAAYDEAHPDLPADTPHAQEGHSCERVFNRVGHMARALHDTLRQLGYDSALEDAARSIPDARERLAYIGHLTEQAACRVLNATDVAIPLQTQLGNDSTALAARWDRLYANQMGVEEFKALAAETRSFLHGVPECTRNTGTQLHEIMMAQDFQDLTGQVIKKIVEMAQQLETGLLQVLIEAMPESKRQEAPDSLLNGPVINAAGRTDVVSSQEQVDDLLESLGF